MRPASEPHCNEPRPTTSDSADLPCLASNRATIGLCRLLQLKRVERNSWKNTGNRAILAQPCDCLVPLTISLARGQPAAAPEMVLARLEESCRCMPEKGRDLV
jgi:hypothetical protein